MSPAVPDQTAPIRVEPLPPCIGAAEGARRLAAAIGGRPQGTDGLVRIEQPIAPTDALDWLANAGDGVRSYFTTRDDALAVAGLGVAAAYEPLPEELPALLARLFDSDPGGTLRHVLTCRFTAVGDDERWSSFGRLRLVLPRVELRTTEAGAVLAAHVWDDPAAYDAERRDALRLLTTAAAPLATPPPFSAVIVDETPDAATWRGAVVATLDAIRAGRLEKCVLARTRTYALDGHVDPFGLLVAAAREQPGTYRFGIQVAPNRAFVGATPELLFRRRGSEVESEALAGTRRRPRNVAEEQRLGRDLLSSEKDRAEHAFVTQHVADALRPLLSGDPQIEGPTLRRLAGLQHLDTRLRGHLADGTADADLLAALHPTPAVCGVPTTIARDTIAALEPFDRGLYCGAVGIVGRDETIVAVGIRCALVTGDRVTLLAGAGIVPGSDADAEWTEAGDKMRMLDAILRAGRAE